MSYLYLPIATGEYASTPDHDRLDILGDIDLQVRFAADDWTPAALGYLLTKWASGQKQFLFGVNTNGTLKLFGSTDGVNTDISKSSSEVPGFTDGTIQWVRVTVDVDNGAGDAEIKFWTGGSGLTPTWVQLGITQLQGTTVSFTAGTHELGIGGLDGTTQMAGELYRARIYDNLAETTPVLDADFTNLTQAEVEAGSFTEDANAAVVTLNGDEWAYVEPHTSGVLGRAELLLRADNKFVKGSPKWPDLSGNNHHAQHGSAAGADTNDPLFLPWTGLQYLYTPEVNANRCHVLDSAAISFTGDLDFTVDVTRDDWINTGLNFLIDKANNSPNFSYRVYLNASGQWVFDTSPDGTSLVSNTTTGTVPFADGSRHTIRFTLDLDDGAGNRVLKVYHDGVLFETVTTAGVASIHNGNNTLTLFGRTADLPWGGKAYRVTLKDGIDGTTEFDADFTDAAILKEPFATFVEKSSNAATVTINRAASGRVSTVVDRLWMLTGTDDFFTIPDNAGFDMTATDDFTVMFQIRVPFSNSGSRIIGNRDTNGGFEVYRDITDKLSFHLRDPSPASVTASSNNNLMVDGESAVWAIVFDRVADTATFYKDGVVASGVHNISAVGDLSSTKALEISRQTGAGSYYDGVGAGYVIWREALSAADVAIAGAEITATDAGKLLLLGAA